MGTRAKAPRATCRKGSWISTECSSGGLALGIQDRVGPEDRCSQFAMHGDNAKRCLISPRGPDRCAAEQDPMARPDDDHGVITLPLDEPVPVSGDLPRVDVTGMGADEAHDRPPDSMHGNICEILADIAREGCRIPGVPGARNDGFPDILVHDAFLCGQSG